MNRLILAASLCLLLLFPSLGRSAISMEPAEYDFGRSLVGEGGDTEIVVRNNGDSARIEDLALRNTADGTFFVRWEECTGRNLEEEESCRFSVGFLPWQQGFFSDLVELTYREDGRRGSPSRESIRLFGEGIAALEPSPGDPPASDPPPSDGSGEPGEPPATENPPGLASLTIESAVIDFGRILLSRREEADIILTNTGLSPVQFGAIAPAAGFADPFSLRWDSCSEQVLSPGGRCQLIVVFFPWDEGTYAGSLDIPFQEEGGAPSLERISVSGEGYVVPGNLLPDIPELIHPEPQQDNLRTSVTLRWQRCNDPDGDPVGYWVFVSQDPGFEETVPSRLDPGRTRLSTFGFAAFALLAGAVLPMKRRVRLVLLVLTVVSILAACGDEIEDNATIPAFGLEGKTTYYWKVVSDDGRGGLSESEVRSFTTR